MFHTIACLAAAVCLASVIGCGGGTSSGGGQSVFVNILDISLSPRAAVVNVGVPVHWVNNTNQPQEVLSGVLAPQPTATVTLIRITAGAIFSPPSTPANPIEANLGDTIRFSNDSTVFYTVSVFNDNNALVFQIPLSPGQLSTVTNVFLSVGAGLYTFSIGGVGSSGAIVLFGNPQPNSGSENSFISPLLGNGGTFTKNFTRAGSVSYYSPNLNNPTRSFKTGVITVN